MLTEAFDRMTEFYLSVFQNTFGRFLPETIIDHLCLVVLVLAIVIEAFVLMYMLRWYCRRSFLIQWAKSHYNRVVCQKMRIK